MKLSAEEQRAYIEEMIVGDQWYDLYGSDNIKHHIFVESKDALYPVYVSLWFDDDPTHEDGKYGCPADEAYQWGTRACVNADGSVSLSWDQVYSPWIMVSTKEQLAYALKGSLALCRYKVMTSRIELRIRDEHLERDVKEYGLAYDEIDAVAEVSLSEIAYVGWIKGLQFLHEARMSRITGNVIVIRSENIFPDREPRIWIFESWSNINRLKGNIDRSKAGKIQEYR